MSKICEIEKIAKSKKFAKSGQPLNGYTTWMVAKWSVKVLRLFTGFLTMSFTVSDSSLMNATIWSQRVWLRQWDYPIVTTHHRHMIWWLLRLFQFFTDQECRKHENTYPTVGRQKSYQLGSRKLVKMPFNLLDRWNRHVTCGITHRQFR